MDRIRFAVLVIGSEGTVEQVSVYDSLDDARREFIIRARYEDGESWEEAMRHTTGPEARELDVLPTVWWSGGRRNYHVVLTYADDMRRRTVAGDLAALATNGKLF